MASDVVDFTDALQCPVCGVHGYFRAHPDGSLFAIMRCDCEEEKDIPMLPHQDAVYWRHHYWQALDDYYALYNEWLALIRKYEPENDPLKRLYAEVASSEEATPPDSPPDPTQP